MRAVMRVSLVSFVVGLAANTAGADGNKDRTPEMDEAARAFLKAYLAKDLDAVMAAVAAPFGIGTLRDPKTLKTGADLRNELKARLAKDAKFPSRVAKTLTWDQAIGSQLTSDEERTTRQQLKPAIDLTGKDGGYAALGDSVQIAKGRKGLAIADTRLLVGIRDGKAKVVGIVVDDPRKR
ncbi:MAG: hypothetical protein U0746_06980 [Gemmataceae bacterium]